MNLHDAKSLALEHIAIHCPEYSFKWLRSNICFGKCYYRRQVIALSQPLVAANEVSQVLDTILHEIAHALTPGHQHDDVWKEKCKELGCKPEACFTFGKGVAAPPKKYVAVCDCCKKAFYKQVFNLTEVNRYYICPSDKTRLSFQNNPAYGKFQRKMKQAEPGKQISQSDMNLLMNLFGKGN